jgi:hypothetical protein
MGLRKRISAKLPLVAACLFIALTVTASDNILLSPGFEDTPSGEAPAFPPWWEWNDIGAVMTGTTGGEVSGKVSHSGKRSVARRVKGKALGCYAQTAEVVPGQIVDAGIWIRTSKEFTGAEAYLRIEFKTKDATIIQAVESKKISSPGESWKLYTIEATPVPERAATAVFCLFVRGKDKNSSGTAWFDDGYMHIKFKGLI